MQGKKLWCQRKPNHHKMPGKLVKKCINSDEPQGDHSENIHAGEIVEIGDGNLGRMVVLICEDLNQELTSNGICDSFLPEWVFSPVLDEGLEEGRWEVT